MDKKTIISKYSFYETKEYYVYDEGTRLASIFDKLIEIAARKCDHYASDIYYDMKRLEEAVDKERHFDKIIVFSDNAVFSYETEQLIKDVQTLPSPITDSRHIWRLEHKLSLDESDETSASATWITTLTRVNIQQI